MNRIYLFLILSTRLWSCSKAFVISSRRIGRGAVARRWASPTDATGLEEEIRSMSIRDLKNQLATLRIPTKDAFEKEELVQRVLKARRQHNGTSQETSATTSVEKSNAIQVPLFLTYMDRNMKVGAVNLPDGEGISIEPSEQPYSTIQITLPPHERPLTLLLDTACSGFVLRPEMVQKYNLPSYCTPVTMTGAGGTDSATGLTQLEQFQLGDETFGPLPAAVQDIGALPSGLDGIIGLSFFNQFACIELDFRAGAVSFFRARPPPRDDMSVVCEADMKMIRLGIYTANVFLGGRGPVNMLVDTGAACSLLSWKGVADLGLSKDSNFVQPLQTRMGAMGSDNMAIQLTHRLNISSKLELGKKDSCPGISLADKSRLSVDVGRIPLLENLQTEGVGGILGIDALMRCAVVRVYCRDSPKIIMLDD